MAEFNTYNLYSYAAGQMQSAADGKVFVDLQRLKSIHDIDEVKDYVDKTFGEVKDNRMFKYPNDVIVFVSKAENKIDVLAVQKDKQIFGNRWYVDEEE